MESRSGGREVSSGVRIWLLWELNPSSVPGLEYTQIDLISNALYIYLVLLFIFIVVGIIIYGVREYTLTYRNRTASLSSAKAAFANWSPDKNDGPNQEDVNNMDLENVGSGRMRDQSLNSIAPSIPFIKLRQLSQKTNATQLLETDNDLMKEIDVIRKIEVIYDEINSSAPTSISQYMIEQEDPQSPKNKKLTYNFQQLNDIRNDMKGAAIEVQLPKDNIVRMSRILQYSIQIPSTNHQSTFQNNKAINEIKSSLIEGKALDLSSKSILILRLVSMGINQNSNFFLNSFNETIEFITDTGIIFELIEQLGNSNMRVMLVEMVLNYCWEHWNFKAPGSFDLIIQSRITIFRVLCNIKLGVSSIESLPSQIRAFLEFKIQTVLRELTKKGHCYDYLEMLPMIAQAIAISEMHNLKYLFYDLVFLIVISHGECCMSDYLADTRTDLKGIVQHGFWYKHDQKIIDKTNEIFKYIVRLNRNIYSWYNEVSEGRIYVSSAVHGSGLNKYDTNAKPDINTKPESNIKNTTRLSTPGGWK